MRDAGKHIGLLKMKLFRPFPVEACQEVLSGLDKVAVLDRNISPGGGGIWAQELKSALYHLPPSRRPQIFSFIAGLGGRDITPDTVEQAIKITLTQDLPARKIYWLDLKE
jgi:pyruvate/2-oxoacid:ferredoxin oxidoreductase alpha subunit